MTDWFTEPFTAIIGEVGSGRKTLAFGLALDQERSFYYAVSLSELENGLSGRVKPSIVVADEELIDYELSPTNTRPDLKRLIVTAQGNAKKLVWITHALAKTLYEGKQVRIYAVPELKTIYETARSAPREFGFLVLKRAGAGFGLARWATAKVLDCRKLVAEETMDRLWSGVKYV